MPAIQLPPSSRQPRALLTAAAVDVNALGLAATSPCTSLGPGTSERDRALSRAPFADSRMELVLTVTTGSRADDHR
jgi:hypothetical protein